MDSGLQAGLVEQGPVQGAAVGTMKRKKLRRNPVRKARLSLKEIHSLVWDTGRSPPPLFTFRVRYTRTL